MKLTFDAKLVQTLLDDSKQAKSWRTPYGLGENAKPGLWLVGDQGVYLMSNSEAGVKHPDHTDANPKFLVAYADQCNPEGDFDEWYSNKRQSFGGDDGVEWLDAQLIEIALKRVKKGKIMLDVTPETIGL